MAQGSASGTGSGAAPAGLMVSVSGIRGRVGHALTPEVIARYAAAFGAWSLSRGGSRSVVVGRDSRVSGAMFHRIVVGTLQLVGCDVIDIGLTTTPGCQLAVEHHHAAGGIMLSASHNPIEWNALKLIGSSGLFLSASEGTAMRALLETGIPYAMWQAIGRVDTDDGVAARHIDVVLGIPYVDVAAIRARRFKVALSRFIVAKHHLRAAQTLQRIGDLVFVTGGLRDRQRLGIERPRRARVDGVGHARQRQRTRAHRRLS